MLTCQRCYCRGHMTEHCDESNAHWVRPVTLEELIPAPVRDMWGITTQTRFKSSRARDEASIHELNPINEITIPSDYGELLRFVEQHGIKVEKSTKPSTDACNKAIMSWAARKGMRVAVQFNKIT
jgi:hypothetical protein